MRISFLYKSGTVSHIILYIEFGKIMISHDVIMHYSKNPKQTISIIQSRAIALSRNIIITVAKGR